MQLALGKASAGSTGSHGRRQLAWRAEIYPAAPGRMPLHARPLNSLIYRPIRGIDACPSICPHKGLMSEIEPPAPTIAAPPPGKWARASMGDRACYLQLANLYWYPVYVWLRVVGRPAAAAAGYCANFFAHLIHGAPPARDEPTAARLREYLLAELRKGLLAGFPPSHAPSVITIDLGSAEASFVRERAASEDDLFSRRWALRVLEQVLETLAQDYATDGKQQLFTALKPFLSYHPNEGGYSDVARSIDMSGSAFHLQVYNFRKRYRALLRGLIADTVRHSDDADSELTALLVAAT
jgi:hypothetical protein